MFDKTLRKHRKGKKKKRLTVSVTNSAGLLLSGDFPNDLGEEGAEGLSLTCQIPTHPLRVKRRLSLKTENFPKPSTNTVEVGAGGICSHTH